MRGRTVQNGHKARRMVTLFRYGLITLMLMVSLVFTASSQNLLVSVSVFDRESKEPIAGANIAFKDTQLGFSTDTLGTFQLFLSPGNYVMVVSHVGYKSRSLSLTMDRNRELNIALTEDLRMLEEVSVSSERPDQNITSTQLGTNKLNVESISKLPSFMGEVDVVKSVLLLPGVTNVGEGTVGLNVRGGNDDQNLILMDGAPLFNSGHLLGFFSAFNPDVVDNITLYKGGIPAQYGGRTSSVLDVKLRNPDMDDWSINGGLGLVANRVSIEGSIVPDKLAVLVAGRVSYPDYLFRISSNEDIRNTKANFYDLTTKWEYRFSDRSRFEFSAYLSNDNFKLSGDSLSNIEINAASSKFNWQTVNTTLTWYRQLGEKTFLRVGAVQSIYESTISSPESANAFTLNSKILLRNFTTDFNWSLTRHEFDFGISANHYQVNPGTLKPDHPASNINFFQIPKDIGLETGIHLTDQLKVSDKISAQLGIRFSNWYTLGASQKYEYMEGIPRTSQSVIDTVFYNQGDIVESYAGIEPRVSVTIKVGTSSSVKANYNRMYQYIQRVSNTTTALPSDRWQLSTSFIKPQQVHQISTGYFRNFKDNTYETSVEFYFKDIDNITDYKDGVNLLLNAVPETAMLQGKGKAYGAELFVKKNKGFVTGWFSYTYSQTYLRINGLYPEERINDGEWYPANYNKPNNLSLAVNYKHDNRITYSANFVFSTGRPFTAPEDKYIVNGIYIPNYIGRNQRKVPDYHRLDLSVTIDANPKKESRLKGSWTFSIYNVYARKNAYSVFFRTKNDSNLLAFRKVNAYKLSVLGTIFPSVTYNFSF